GESDPADPLGRGRPSRGEPPAPHREGHRGAPVRPPLAEFVHSSAFRLGGARRALYPPRRDASEVVPGRDGPWAGLPRAQGPGLVEAGWRGCDRRPGAVAVPWPCRGRGQGTTRTTQPRLTCSPGPWLTTKTQASCAPAASGNFTSQPWSSP